MDISLTPKELRDLLDPWISRKHFREPLDLDRMSANEVARIMFTPSDAEADAEGLTAQRALVTTLADLAQAQEELVRTKVLVEEKAEELRQLIENYGKVRQTPIMQANAVIENAGTQAHDAARIFFLETGSSAWYEGLRATLKNLLDTLGVEVDEQLEEHLKSPEPPVEEPAPLVEQTPPPFDTEEEMIRTLASDEPRPTLQFGGRRSTLGADSVDAVPPAGSQAAAVAVEVAAEGPFEVVERAWSAESQCKHCGEELRKYPEGWIDRETHSTGADGHTHEPAEDALGDDIEF